ncbi:MAG: ribonuclease III [Alphaproteobacteria bacterium]|nr:ribonuclease III [Alphaproteobacteria bacterium]
MSSGARGGRGRDRARARAAPAFDDDALAAVEARIGRAFSDGELFRRALTHSSLAADSSLGDLERLEFLGDRVLGLLTAEALWRRHPSMTEGELAPRLNALVRKETCAKAALALGLDRAMRLSPHEEEAGGRRKTSILGDVCEAFLGALYIDGGLDAARRAYDVYWTPNLDQLYRAHRDAKTALQEWSQERGRGTPKYETLRADGPAHSPGFAVRAVIDGASAEGEGASKRAAQSAAAAALLIQEGVWTEHDV